MRLALASLFLAVTITHFQPAESLGDDQTSRPTTYKFQQSGQWRIWQTQNFRICTRHPKLDLSSLPAACEQLKREIEQTWFPGSSESSWSPRCDVIIHGSLGDYQRALGAEVGDSAGCATMKYDSGRVISRNVDLRIDSAGWQIDTLPHELTHVVLADKLGNRRIPPWLDEGIGVLSESKAKLEERASAYQDAIKRHTVYSASELTQVRSFPPADYRDAFYLQSAAVVRLLRDRGEPDDFARFAERVMTTGVDQALRDIYQLDNTQELQRLASKTDLATLVTNGDRLGQPKTLFAEMTE